MEQRQRRQHNVLVIQAADRRPTRSRNPNIPRIDNSTPLARPVVPDV